MAWVKIDDHFDEHPKIAQAGPLAVAVWLAGLAYCNRNLTDGFIPWSKAQGLVSWQFLGAESDDPRGRKRYTVALTCGHVGEDVETPFVVDCLLDAGLWEEVDGGYLVHDYLDYQPSKEQVLAERHATKDRVSRWRERNGVTSSVTSSVSNTAPVPVPVPVPVPDTLEPEPTVQGARARDAASAAAPKEPPSPSKQSVPLKKPAAEQPTPEGYALLGEICEVTNSAPRGDQRRRDALHADELLRRCGGDATEAVAYVQFRLNRGDSPQLQFAAKDYAPGWRKKAATDRAGPRGGNGQMSDAGQQEVLDKLLEDIERGSSGDDQDAQGAADFWPEQRAENQRQTEGGRARVLEARNGLPVRMVRPTGVND